jgi:hypothetical protein
MMRLIISRTMMRATPRRFGLPDLMGPPDG